VAFHLRTLLAHLAPGTLEKHVRARCAEIAASVEWADPPKRRLAAPEQAILRDRVGRGRLVPLLERHATEKRAALRRWADHVERLVAGEAGGNVVAFGR
jgi:hypothetical protein